MIVAALYVEPGGVYYGLDDVEPWGLPEKDARDYPGPHPVVAHPPCKRWGRYWPGGPSATTRRLLGDDGGCFDRALWAVENFGGVLEHPEASHAWRYYGIPAPPRGGGWTSCWPRPGWSCCVEQGVYGHRARKATWLYAVGCELPSLDWSPSETCDRMDDGFHSAAERARGKKSGPVKWDRLSKRERLSTPVEFRYVLLAIARSSRLALDGVGE